MSTNAKPLASVIRYNKGGIAISRNENDEMNKTHDGIDVNKLGKDRSSSK